MAGENLVKSVSRKALAAIALLSLIAAVSGASEQKPDPWALRVTPVTSPSSPGSGQPQLTVSSRGILLSWVERQGPKAALKLSDF